MVHRHHHVSLPVDLQVPWTWSLDLCWLVRRLLDDGAKLFANFDDWYLWVKPQRLTDALDLVSASTRSINLELQPSKIQVWRASCPDPVPPELLKKVKPTHNCLGGHPHIQGDSEPSPMDKTIRRSRGISRLNSMLQVFTRRLSMTFSQRMSVLPVNMCHT